ncbi:MAG: class I SAM-dependent DNA methyltransferase, partial [Verrucomicrobia bacterium]|nr:class I SAM-dependent DNA methyltransferase [Verrucomicrobiota bacterium]
MPHLSWSEVRDRSIRFSREWSGATSERADKQTFWNEFFDVFGIRRASVAAFEANVRNLQGHTNAIDLLWRGKLLVEHKSLGQSLDAAETQALGYIEDLARENRQDEIPRFVLVSDFAHFTLFDLEPEEQRDLPLFAGRPSARISFTLGELPRVIRSFAFMLGQTRVRLDPEDPANEKAYARMCELHDALKTGGFTGHELERLLVRILFCVFAEDTGIFEPEVFSRFIRTQTRDDGSDLGAQLNQLFDWLNSPQADRPVEDGDPLYGFRYVNGDLFAERLGFPRCTRDMRAALLYCCEFQWAKISPAVFGSLFQGVLDDKARRQQGAHYTSERDIMKVLRSLFLDELKAELEQLKRDRSNRRRANLEAFQQRLRSLRFLDPACGCGNFLVLGYRELRLLEMEVVRALHGAEQQVLDVRQLLKVDVDQFYGIEYSEWPARIAEVAMWLMDHQMNGLAAEAFGQGFDRLPLRSSPHIVQSNALRVDWNNVLPRKQCAYVMGNPPFVGAKYQSDEQRADMDVIASQAENSGLLDYVAGWYFQAAEYIRGTRIVVAFVSTNSISQGEQVGVLWNHLFQHYRLKIHFAHRPFTWQSEARGRAHVHVVVIGFAAFDTPEKRIYDYEDETPTSIAARNISPYLVEGTDLAIVNRSTPLCNVPEMGIGNKPIDDGNYLFTPEEKAEFLRIEPAAKQYFRRWVGSEEFINGIERWCLWLGDCPPSELRQMPHALERVENVRKVRLASKSAPTRKIADTPTRFHVENMPGRTFLVVPEVSSERRHYIPIGFMQPSILCSNLVKIVPDATPFHFGILSSTMHMAWVRQVCGRLESRYATQTNSSIITSHGRIPRPSSGRAWKRKRKPCWPR